MEGSLRCSAGLSKEHRFSGGSSKASDEHVSAHVGLDSFLLESLSEVGP